MCIRESNQMDDPLPIGVVAVRLHHALAGYAHRLVVHVPGVAPSAAAPQVAEGVVAVGLVVGRGASSSMIASA